VADRARVIGDIGGTNARFVLLDDTGTGFSHLITMKCANFETPELAIAHYLESLGAPTPDVICLAAAGPVVDGRVRLTNLPWHLDTRTLGRTFGNAECWILNDFEAVAYGLPAIPISRKQQLGSVPETELNGDYCICAVGPGTGLGAAGLVWRNGVTEGLVTEAGHVGFENKGRHRGLHERVPTHLIRHSEPGLAGAAVVARRIVG
jgi:glucokinase